MRLGCEHHADERVQYRVMLLGGLTGRLDQTAHTLSTLLQLRKTARTIWAFSQMSMACVLDQVRPTHHLICQQSGLTGLDRDRIVSRLMRRVKGRRVGFCLLGVMLPAFGPKACAGMSVGLLTLLWSSNFELKVMTGRQLGNFLRRTNVNLEPAHRSQRGSSVH